MNYKGVGDKTFSIKQNLGKQMLSVSSGTEKILVNV